MTKDQAASGQIRTQEAMIRSLEGQVEALKEMDERSRRIIALLQAQVATHEEHAARMARDFADLIAAHDKAVAVRDNWIAELQQRAAVVVN